MGINFYCKRIPNEDDYKKLQKCIDEKQLDELQDLLEDINKVMHIGLRSKDWAFLFQAKDENGYEPLTDVPWESNVESLFEYLKQPDVEIYNECRKKLTFDEFINEIKDYIYVDEHHYDLDSYYEAHLEQHRHYFGSNSEWTVMHNGKPTRWCNVYFS